MDTNSDIYTLNGNFDLILLSACTMSCSGCSYLDYLDDGCTIDGSLKIENVKEIVTNLLKLKVKLKRLTMLGGEPTIHPQFLEIVKYLHQHKGIVYDELKVITNGTFFNERFLHSLEYLDSVRISIYPLNKELETAIIKSKLANFIKSKCHLEFYRRNEFEDYNNPIPNYTANDKWNICWKKQWCRVLMPEGIYRCNIAYNDKTEVCDFTSKQKLINYIENNDIPLEKCKTCPIPCEMIEWKSNNEERDTRNIERGIRLIEQWKTTLNLRNII